MGLAYLPSTKQGAWLERPISRGEPRRMKFNPWYLLAPVPVAVMASQGAFGAQLVVLGVTLGIFFGTLSLRRPQAGDATTTQH